MKNLVIFGASGNLAKSYLFPAIKRSLASGQRFGLYGFGRSEITVPQNFTYIRGEYDREGLKGLAEKIDQNSIFYLAIPIQIDIVKKIVEGLIFYNLLGEKSQLVLEKPFGNSYDSAKELMDYLLEKVGEDKIFLVDHYLTKRLVKNIVSLRFSNPIFEHLWNSEFIKEINFTAIETKGIENRGEFYEQNGAIRDIFQNHLLQLMTLVTMNKPEKYIHSCFEKSKSEILRAVKVEEKSVQVGQYGGYLKEEKVATDSITETMAKIRLYIDLPQWKKVPMNFTFGKKLGKRITEINIVFKQENRSLTPNQLTICLQPKNDIQLTLNSSFNIDKDLPRAVNLNLGTLDASIDSTLAYENILGDLMKNNKINTPSFEEILLQWQITDKVRKIPGLFDKLYTY